MTAASNRVMIKREDEMDSAFISGFSFDNVCIVNAGFLPAGRFRESGVLLPSSATFRTAGCHRHFAAYLIAEAAQSVNDGYLHGQRAAPEPGHGFRKAFHLAQ